MKEKAGGGFGHEAINSEFAAENILGGAHTVFHVRLDLNKTSCRVQQQRSGREAASESRLRPTITNDIILFCPESKPASNPPCLPPPPADTELLQLQPRQ